MLDLQVKILMESERLTKEGNPASKGIAFAEFADHEHALCALRQLNNNPAVFGEHLSSCPSGCPSAMHASSVRQEANLELGPAKVCFVCPWPPFCGYLLLREGRLETLSASSTTKEDRLSLGVL